MNAIWYESGLPRGRERRAEKNQLAVGEIFNTIKNGVPPEFNMAAWGEAGVKDPDIWNVVNYIRSVTKK